VRKIESHDTISCEQRLMLEDRLRRLIFKAFQSRDRETF